LSKILLTKLNIIKIHKWQNNWSASN